MINLNYPNFWQRKSIISYLLLPLSFLYFIGTFLRKLLAKCTRLNKKVICVGNSTIGGTGKTQVVIWLAEHFKKRGTKFVIICKGYGGSYIYPTLVTKEMGAGWVGDEALELFKYGTTIVSRNITDAKRLLKTLSPDVIIVDDGMQNPNFIKDYVLMVIDGDRGFGNEMLFPAGPMRQSVKSGFKIADSSVVISSDSESSINSKISYHAAIKPRKKHNLDKKYYAFAGIGNPERFFNSAKACGLDIVATKTFGDHHKYSMTDLEFIMAQSKKIGAVPITTRKDYVKLDGYIKDHIEVFDVKLDIKSGEKLIEDIYEKILPQS